MDNLKESLDKLNRLESLAEADGIYQFWKTCFKSCENEFEKYVESQPKEIRNILWGYASCGQMMMQRKAIIACEKMEFLEE